MLGNGSTTNIAEHKAGGSMCDFVRAAVMHLAWQTQLGMNQPLRLQHDLNCGYSCMVSQD